MVEMRGLSSYHLVVLSDWPATRTIDLNLQMAISACHIAHWANSKADGGGGGTKLSSSDIPIQMLQKDKISNLSLGTDREVL